MPTAIVTDSTCDLPAALTAERQIYVVPQYVVWGTKSYLDGVELTAEEFYRRLPTEKILPKTSQPSPGDFAAMYRKAKEETNADAIVCITLTADLSGTHNSAVQAVSQVDFPVHVIDARTASLPLGFLVLTAADARDAGQSAEQIAATVKAALSKVQIYFTLATLEYLQRGGRIGAASRFIGDTLNIRPILFVDHGKVGVKEKVRTRSRGVKRLAELIAEAQQGHTIKRLGVIHGAALDEAQELADTLKNRFGVDPVYLTSCCSAVGVHMGPGVIGVVYQLN